LRLSSHSPPFPYTTLFRSCEAVGRDDQQRCVDLDVPPAQPAHRESEIPRTGIIHGLGFDALDHGLRDIPILEAEGGSWARPKRTDRKSTRLNSSHVKISYA